MKQGTDAVKVKEPNVHLKVWMQSQDSLSEGVIEDRRIHLMRL